MKSILGLLIIYLLTAPGVHAQKTPADFGNTAFWCFQHNRLDSLFRLIPSISDLSGFAKGLGISEGSPAYTAFMNRYPLVIKSFKDKSYQIQHDSLDFHFSWARARLDKIEPLERSFIPENVPNKIPVSSAVVNIYFSSGNQSFVLKFGDLHPYNGYWKSGNDISLTIQYQ